MTSETLKPEEDQTVVHPTELQELNGDIKWSLGVAIGSLTLAGASVYAAYEVLTGKNSELSHLAFDSGGFLVSAGVAIKTVPQSFSLIRKRNSLKKVDSGQK